MTLARFVRHSLVVLAALWIGTVAYAQASRSSAGIRMTQMTAQVRIIDGVATTQLRQVLHNDRSSIGEAVWILPLPKDSVADGFTMKVAGVEMSGDVLDANTARTVYENIVRQRRDPGLLEYVGHGCLRARIFPIPAGGDVEVEVVYRNVLPVLGGLHRWTLPMKAMGVSGLAPSELILDLTVESTRPLLNVFSPSRGVHVIKEDEHLARASFEGSMSAASTDELALFFGLSDEQFGLDLLSYRESGDDLGTFLLMLSPRQELESVPKRKRAVTFVIDTSGSMKREKIRQAKEAVRFFLGSLSPGDHFNVIPFSTSAEPFYSSPVPALDANIQNALARVDALRAEGGTNISDALQAGLDGPRAPDGRLPIVVFLTDGVPTVAETDVRKILADAGDWNNARARLFVFGVGSGVNTLLLDKLAAQNGGTRDYVLEGEPIEEKTSALFSRISHPVMTDLQITMDGVTLTKQVPARMPDLFRGDRLLLFGRYLEAGDHAIRLSGTVGGQTLEYVYEGHFASEPRRELDFVPALWAQRRVGILLDEIRLNGAHAELLDEVKSLGLKHNIVTPYTSHLIVEEGLGIDLLGGGNFRGPGDSVPPPGGGSTRPRRGAAWQGGHGIPPHPADRKGGGGGGGGPSSPGPSGPSAPGPSGQGAPGPSGPSAPGPSGQGAPGPSGPKGPATGGGRGSSTTTVPTGQLIDVLLDAGILPKDAHESELRMLAAQIAQEMRASASSFNSLGRQVTGSQAVNDSAYLGRLISGSSADGKGFGTQASRSILMKLFTRKVGDKVFRLRQGVWVDGDYKEEQMGAPSRSVIAFSQEYFALGREMPTLNLFLSLSTRLLVVLDGKVIEVTDPPRKKEADERPVPTGEESTKND